MDSDTMDTTISFLCHGSQRELVGSTILINHNYTAEPFSMYAVPGALRAALNPTYLGLGCSNISYLVQEVGCVSFLKSLKTTKQGRHNSFICTHKKHQHIYSAWELLTNMIRRLN